MSDETKPQRVAREINESRAYEERELDRAGAKIRDLEAELAEARADNAAIVKVNATYTDAHALQLAELAAKDAEIERLREIVKEDDVAMRTLELTPELNMSNYDRDQVAALNGAVTDAVNIMVCVRQKHKAAEAAKGGGK